MSSCNSLWHLFVHYLFNDIEQLLCQIVLDQPVSSFRISFLTYLKIFGLTNLLEWPFYAFFLKRWGVSLKKSIGIVLILNLATHPIVCFVWPALGQAVGASYGQYIIFSEIFAPLIEAVILARLLKKSYVDCFWIALFCNLISWNIGVFLL